MADSGVRAPLAALALVFGATLAAYFWHQQNAAAPEAANPAAPASPASPQEAQKPVEAAKPADAPKLPELKALEPKSTPSEPHFDIVRVEPTGEAVIAGKGEPGAKVELLASGKVVAEAKADPNGNFVILPSALTPGGYDLTLRQTPEGKAAVESTQSVAVSIPAKGGGHGSGQGKDQVVVALSEPGKPTKILPVPPVVPQKPMVLPAPTSPAPPAPAPEVTPAPPAPPPAPAAESRTPEVATAAPAVTPPDTAPPPAAPPPAATTPVDAAPPPPPGVAIRSAELENGNGFFASGTAAAGTHVRIYLNDTPLAEVVAGPDGQWTVTVKKGLAGGHYKVRADAGSGAAVTSRAEVPFDVPVAMAQAAPAAPAASPSVAPTSAAKQPPAQQSTDRGPEPPSAPNPSEVIASAPASPSTSVEETAGAPSHNPPAPRPDLTANATPVAPTPPAAPAKQETHGSQAEATPTVPNVPPSGAPSPNANAVVEQVETAVVVPGDNLWNISRARLGHGRRFTQIYAANTSQIRNPRLIYPGQVLVVPPK